MIPFPIPAPAFDGRSRAVGVDAAFVWLRFGWGVFMVNPFVWMASTLILAVGFFALMVAGWIGALLTGLLAPVLAPVLAAGLLAMCRRATDEEVVGFSDLAAGFTTRTASLIALGVIYWAAIASIALLVFLLLGGYMGTTAFGLMWFGLFAGGVLFLALLLWLLAIPLCMAMWFAPALVLFNGMSPCKACKASFWAILKNILPFLILGLIVNILSFLAMLPAGLGYLVLVPVLAGTVYASYRDVFLG
jgi:uncharacterized membrane protein